MYLGTVFPFQSQHGCIQPSTVVVGPRHPSQHAMLPMSEAEEAAIGLRPAQPPRGGDPNALSGAGAGNIDHCPKHGGANGGGNGSGGLPNVNKSPEVLIDDLGNNKEMNPSSVTSLPTHHGGSVVGGDQAPASINPASLGAPGGAPGSSPSGTTSQFSQFSQFF